MAGHNKGDKIQYTDFNASVDKLEKYWGDKYPSSAFSDPNNTDHRFGWGQNTAEPTVSPRTVIEATHINKLRAQVNSGHYHIDNNITFNQTAYDSQNAPTLIPAYSTLDVIDDRDLYKIEYQIDEIATRKFNIAALNSLQVLGYSGVVLPNPDGVTINNGASLWDDTLFTEFKYTWTNYQNCRYFFNSGGKLIVNLSAVGGSIGSDDWINAFDQIDIISVGAEQTLTQTGKSGGLGGFYDIGTTYTTIFESRIGFDNAYAYAYSSSYAYAYIGTPSSVYGSAYNAQYGGRRIKIEGKAQDTGSTFEVTIKVTLIEDFDDIYLVDTDITCDAGFIQPIDSPAGNPTSVSDPFWNSSPSNYYKGDPSNNLYPYQFQDREYPVMSTVTAWTATGSGTSNIPKVFSISPDTTSTTVGNKVTFTVSETTGTMGTGGLYIDVVSTITTFALEQYVVNGYWVADYVLGTAIDPNLDPEFIPASSESASGFIRLENNTGEFEITAYEPGTYEVVLSTNEFQPNGTEVARSAIITVT